MRNVFARAKAASIGQAITNGASSNAQLFDVVARATGGDFAVGFSNEFRNPTLKNVDVRVEGGLAAFGVSSQFGTSVILHEVKVVATAGERGVGLLTDASKAMAHGSTLQGDGFSVDNRFDASSVSLIRPVRAGSGILRSAVS